FGSRQSQRERWSNRARAPPWRNRCADNDDIALRTAPAPLALRHCGGLHRRRTGHRSDRGSSGMIEMGGEPRGAGLRIAVVASRFNSEITGGLVVGAMGALKEAGVAENDIALIRVPGAFEIPLAAKRAATSGRFDGIVAIGCVIRGETAHFEYISLHATN